MHRKENPGPIGNWLRFYYAWIGNSSLVGSSCSNSEIRSTDGWDSIKIRQDTWVLGQVKPPAPLGKHPPRNRNSSNPSLFELKQIFSGFVHWHWDSERYLGPQECRVEVRNILIKVSPLEQGYPPLPPEIRYDATESWLPRRKRKMSCRAVQKIERKLCY